MVIAGAGSGKTRVLTYRIAYLVRLSLASPHSILALTFTKKAAQEMRERLSQLLGERADKLVLGTFHALALQIVKTECAKLGFDPHKLLVYDAADARETLKRAIVQAHLDERRWDVEQIASAITDAKQRLREPVNFTQVKGDYFEDIVALVYATYQELLKQANAMDFDDLILCAVKLLREYPDVLDFYQTIYRYILVDEFQDAGDLQYEMVRLIAQRHENLCVVGSPAQAIYGWRGVNTAALLKRYERDFPTTDIVVLDQNYRSTHTIISAANTVIQGLNTREKELWTHNAAGAPITLMAAATEHDEARFVANEIIQLVRDEGLNADECMALFRTHLQARALEQALIQVGLPYTLEGQTSFFNLKEIKDVLAYLSLAYNPENALALERVINTPPRKLGGQTLQRIKGGEHQLTLARVIDALHEDDLKPSIQEALQAFYELIVGTLYEAASLLSVTDLFDFVLAQTGYDMWLDHFADSQKRRANLAELRLLTYRYRHVEEPRESLGTFLNDVALLTDSDPIYLDHGGVKLITVHAAKGLEARVVFLLGLEEGIFPHHRSLGTQSELNEERRVFYVGLTRAMERLYLSYARTRTAKDGRVNDHPPSRFLREVPRHLIERK